MVHGWYYGRQVRRSAREVGCGIFEYLSSGVWYDTVLCNIPCTFNVSQSSLAITHSSSVNSNRRRSFLRSDVMCSTAVLYFTMKHSISYVEFHLVIISREMSLNSSFSSSRHTFQAGRRIIDECTILKATLRS